MLFANLVQICSSPTNLLLWTILGQTVIMAFAWSFIGAILLIKFIILPDHIVQLIVKYPTVLTLIVTLISTILSIITSTFFTFAVKEALRYHLSGPITLIKLRTAVALSKLNLVLRWRSLKLSALTLAACTMVASLHTSWSTLLLPTLIQWPVKMTGTELDLGSAAFVNQLTTDSGKDGAAPVFATINLVTLLSGLDAMYNQGGPNAQPNNMFNFNGVLYNRSTGGVIPAIEEYSGSSTPPGPVGLQFSGGQVPVNTSFDWGHFRDAGTHQGVAKNYTVTQQGVTANVTCQPMDPNQISFNITNITTQGPPKWDMTYIMWEVFANCSGTVNYASFTTVNNMNGQMDAEYEGFLPILVCSSYPMTLDPNKFDIFMLGTYQYIFLPATRCEVALYLTTVNVTYNGGIVSVDRIGTSSVLTTSVDSALTKFITAVTTEQADSTQGMTGNTIGDFLTAFGTNDTMYNDLEEFWRGTVEFASTLLRSGYTASGVPSNMTRPTSGTMYFTTYGWQSNSLTYILVLVVITLIWGITVLAAGYSLIQEKINPSASSFDFSDLVGLVIAASDGILESGLWKGDRDKVEDIVVRFEDVPDDVGRIIRKRLVTVVPESLLQTTLLGSESYDEKEE